MRRQHIALVICAFLASFFFADAAHAVYHPTQGRWLQRDPIGYARGTGLYQYGLSSPPNSLDPSGMYDLSGQHDDSHWRYEEMLGWSGDPAYAQYRPEGYLRPPGGFINPALPSPAYAVEAALIDLAYLVLGDNDLPPKRSPSDFVHSRDYCCECVPLARRKRDFAKGQQQAYANASGETAAEVEVEVKGDRDLVTGGTTHPVLGPKAFYPQGPCSDLVYQARSEHERIHWDDRNALLTDHSRSFTRTWNSGGFRKQTEGKAYASEAGFYEGFIDECKRQFPEVTF